MLVFIGWSGETSHEVAIALKNWLSVLEIRPLETYISDEISKGSLWFLELKQKLKKSDFGILCMTKENLRSPWLFFEAGALFMSNDEARLSPFLFDVSRQEMTDPMNKFQHTDSDKGDLWKLAETLNRICGDGLSVEELKRRFESSYPVLENAFYSIRASLREDASREEDDISELMEELRSMQKRLYGILSSQKMTGGRQKGGAQTDESTLSSEDA